MRCVKAAGLLLALTCLKGILSEAKGKIDITCDALADNHVDWDCILGPDSLEEVHERGGTFTSCRYKRSKHPCSRFIVKKEAERSEVKVQQGPSGFPFKKNERYVFKYSFRAVESMKVATRFTHLGQIKGSKGGYMIKGDPIYSLTANKYGLMVRFSNKDTIEDFHPGLEKYLNWEDATGEWVDVKITTVFGRSMEVEISGAVKGKAVWPSKLGPVAWHRDAEMARLKLGLYHSKDNVADGEVEFRKISIEGPNGIIRTSPKEDDEDDDDDAGGDGVSAPRSFMSSAFDKTCGALKNNQIDWECVFGEGALDEVHQRGGKFTTCPKAKNSIHPCSLFVVKKDEERSEVKVKAGPEGFSFLKHERYVFKYSFRAKEGMKVSKRYTHLGQLKGAVDPKSMISGDPIYSLTANTDGLMVRFSNRDTTDNFIEGLEKHLDWNQATGQWVHVTITTVFGESMEVTLSGAVEGKAVWPKDVKPVAWHNDGNMVRAKLGLYHKTDLVHDGEVEYRDISVEGPNGKIRTSPRREHEGNLYLGCYEDEKTDRILNKSHFIDAHMTTEMCADLCEGSAYFGTQYGTECWCGRSSSDINKHGSSTKCNSNCAGGGRIQKCGGKYAVSVYQYEGTPRRIPGGTTYLGCYADDPADRALTLKKTSDGAEMTYEFCNKFCRLANADYFGVQYGRECFCGKSSDNYDKHGTSTCSMQCPGSSSSVCGGGRALNVFKI